MNWLKNETDEISAREEQVAEYQKEIEKNKSVIEDLENKPQFFQITNCTACQTPLETPTVHFLCKHSYHQQ